MDLELPRIDPGDWRSYELLQRVIDAIPDPVFVKDRMHRWIAFNAAFTALIGRSREELLGASDPDFWPADQAAVFWEMDDQVFESGQPNENEEVATGSDDVERTIWTRKYPLRNDAGDVVGLCGIISDITALKQRLREAERIERENQQHRAVIAAQAEMLEAMAMPVVEIGAGILLVPLVGELSERRMTRAMEGLLAGIASTRARVVLLDLTGVPAIDAAIARNLLGALQAARLLGCHSVLCGIGPDIARMLVTLEVDFGAIVTRGTLRAGLAHAEQVLAGRL